jgi:hypothetical protein
MQQPRRPLSKRSYNRPSVRPILQISVRVIIHKWKEYFVHEVRLRDANRPDARCRFSSVVSYSVPKIVFALFRILCWRRDDRRHDAQRRVAGKCNNDIQDHYCNSAIQSQYRNNVIKDVTDRHQRVLMLSSLTLKRK